MHEESNTNGIQLGGEFIKNNPLAVRMMEWVSGGDAVSVQMFLDLSCHPHRGSTREFDAPSVINHAMAREAFMIYFGFAMIVSETIDELLPYGPFLEVGAGSGYLSRLLANRGADVIATDIIDQQHYGFTHGRWFDIVKMDAADAAARHPDRTVLMSWPCMGEDWSAQVLDAIVPGQKVLHIGEGRGGCTGCARLYDLLGTCFERVEGISLPRFYGMHDAAAIYRRR